MYNGSPKVSRGFFGWGHSKMLHAQAAGSDHSAEIYSGRQAVS